MESMLGGGFPLAALLLTAMAAGWDLAVRRIPNALTVTAMAAALAAHAAANAGGGLAGSVGGFAWSAAGLAAGTGLLLIPALFGGMGGGDLKLMAALGAILGPHSVLDIALVSAVAGGFLAFAAAVRRGVVRAALARALGLRRRRRAPNPASPRPGALGTIPYGVAIAVATWICVLAGGPL